MFFPLQANPFYANPGPVLTDRLIRRQARSTKALGLGVGWGDGGRNPVAIAMPAARGLRSAVERLFPVGRPCFHTSGKKRLLDRNGRKRRGHAAASPRLPDLRRNRMDPVANAERRVAPWNALRVHHASHGDGQAGLGGQRARRPAWSGERDVILAWRLWRRAGRNAGEPRRCASIATHAPPKPPGEDDVSFAAPSRPP